MWVNRYIALTVDGHMLIKHTIKKIICKLILLSDGKNESTIAVYAVYRRMENAFPVNINFNIKWKEINIPIKAMHL